MKQSLALQDQYDLKREQALAEIETLPFKLQKELEERIHKGIGVVDEFEPDNLYWSQKVRLLPKDKVAAGCFVDRTKKYLQDKINLGD